MKIAAIRSIVKDAGVCVIYTSERGRQWLGTNKAMFLCEEGLKITERMAVGLLDLDEKEQKNIRFSEMALEESRLYALPRKDQNEMRRSDVFIKIMGTEFTVLDFNGKTWLADGKLIKGAVGSADYRGYWLGWNQWDEPLIIISDGLCNAGVIRPEPQEAVEEIQQKLRWIAFCRAGGGAGVEEKTDALPEETGVQLDMEEFGG